MRMFNPFKSKASGVISFEHQLEILAKGGITLDPRVRPEALLESFSKEQFEKDPYRLLLGVMGNEADVESQAGEHGYPSDQIWHFDTECIEGNGSYMRIADRMRVLSQGTLPLELITDSVDLEEETAWLAFSLSGERYKWPAKLNEDWVDPAILSQLAALLESLKTGRRFTYVDLKAQDCLIGCATEKQRSFLESNTGLKFDWLK